jgi:hypothetical protein
MAKDTDNKQAAASNDLYRNAKKLREEILSTEREIADILSKINKLSENETANAKELVELRDQALKKEKELVDKQNESIAAAEKSVKMSKEGVFQLQEQRNLQEEMMDSYWGELLSKQENQNKLQTVLNTLEEKFQEEVGAASDAMGLLNDNAKKVLETTNYTDVSNKKVQVAYSRSNELLKEQGDLSQSFLKYLQEQEWTVGEMANLQSDVVNQVDKAAAGQYESVDLTRAKLELEKEARSLQNSQNKMTAEEYNLSQDILQSKRDALAGIESQQDAFKKASEEAGKVLGVMEKVTSGDFKGALLQQFRLDDINKQIKEKVGGALVNVINEVKSGNLKGAFSAAGDGLKSMIGMAPKLLAALGIGAILMLGNFLVNTFMEADKEVAQLGKDFGISKNEAKELHHTAVDVANEMKITGVHSEQIAKGLKDVSDNLGGIDLTGAFSGGNAAVQQMVKDTTILTEKFGLSGEEAGNLNDIAALTGKSVGEMSMMSTKLGNGIFSAKESMKILAGIPKSVVSSMSKMPEAMIKTAQHAKMLGLNMKQIADIGRKSLDIEQSLEAEMEARAILGRDINLDKMRAAALDGDQETVMKELLNAAGSAQEFNDMNVLQKEALAKAAGMEVEQMADMLAKQEALNKAGLSQAAVEELQKKNAAELNEEAKKLAGTEKGKYLEKLAAEKKSEETQAGIADLMKRIQELAVKLVTPIMDVVDAFMNGEEGAAAMDGILNAVGGTIKMIVPGIKMIASLIGYLLKPLSMVFGLFSSTEETTGQVADAASNVAGGVQQVSDKVKPLTSRFGSLLGIVSTLGGFFVGKALLGKGMDMLKDKAGDLGKSLISKVGGPLGKIGGKLFGGGKKEEAGGGGGDKAAVGEAEKGKNMVSGILDKIKSIIDSIKGVVQSAIGFVRDVGKDLLATLKDLIAGIGDILREGATIVVDVGTKLAEGAMKILNIIMDGLASAANRLPDIMGALGKAVVAFFTPLQSLVNPMIIAGIAIFTGAMIGLGYAFKLLGEGIGAAAPGITAFFDGVGTVVQAVGEAISKVIETITTSIIRLQDIDGDKLLTTAAGIVAIGGAMAALGAGKAAEGFGSFVGSLFGGGDDPMDKLISFTERIKPEKLAETANGLKALTSTFSSFSTALETMATAIDKLNMDKLDSVIEKLEEAKSLNESSIGEGIASVAQSFVGGITSIFGSSEEQKTQGVATGGGGGNKGGDKLDQVIGLLSQILGTTNQPTVIKFGDKTVEEIKSQLNFKKAYNIATDNTYGRAVD